jgi:triosephosphate isomerase
MRPIIIVNLKAYDHAIGAGAVKLAKICSEVAKKTKSRIACAVQPTDVYRVSQAVKIPVYSQHVDCVGKGAHTGWLLCESLKAAKGVGSLVNHSEHRIPIDNIKRNIAGLKQNKLTSIVCASGPAKVKQLAKFKPDFIAYQPPALIGGKVSVSDAKPSIIKNCVKLAGRVPLLVGAGVHNEHDVRVALELGAKGILVASGVVKNKNPRKALIDLCRGLK